MTTSKNTGSRITLGVGLHTHFLGEFQKSTQVQLFGVNGTLKTPLVIFLGHWVQNLSSAPHFYDPYFIKLQK